MILILELGLMQLSQLWGFRHGGCHDHHKSPHGAFTHKYAQTQTASPTHSHRLCTSGFMVCEQHRFFMRGLDKQHLEPIDR